MPSKKRKYNARFPAGRIKKIMQTDEEVGKVAQAVPIIISRTLEMFVESLLTKAHQVTSARNAKTLSPSHLKQCILAESRFDFLKDLVKNIPDVSAAEEKEMMSAESSPNSTSRFPEGASVRRFVREDSHSPSSSEPKLVVALPSKPSEKQLDPVDQSHALHEPANSEVMDLSTKPFGFTKPNFYKETQEVDTGSVIRLNPYVSQPSTSYTSLTPIPLEKPKKIDLYKPFDVRSTVNNTKSPVTPILNIDFTKNIAMPEIRVLDSVAASMVGMEAKTYSRKNSRKEKELKPATITSDDYNSGNLQIDEDYDT